MYDTRKKIQKQAIYFIQTEMKIISKSQKVRIFF